MRFFRCQFKETKRILPPKLRKESDKSYKEDKEDVVYLTCDFETAVVLGNFLGKYRREKGNKFYVYEFEIDTEDSNLIKRTNAEFWYQGEITRFKLNVKEVEFDKTVQIKEIILF